MRGFKRIAAMMAAGIAIAQIFTVMPVYAQEEGTTTYTCAHDECNNGVEVEGYLCTDCNQSLSMDYSKCEDGCTHQINYSCDCGYKESQNENCYFAGGTCSCGRTKSPTDTKCAHANCENTATETSAFCQDCYSRSMIVSAKYVDENSHMYYEKHECCGTLISKYLQPHSYRTDGKCFCGYSQNSGSSSETKDEPKKEEKEEVKNESQPVEEPVVEPVKNTVQSSDGTTITSSVSGVYASQTVNGAAVISPVNNLNEAIGITDSGTNASYYVCDNRNLFRLQDFKNATEKDNKHVYKLFNSDLYAISKQGKVEKIHSSEQPVTLKFGLPVALQNKSVSIVAYNNKTGEYTEFQDTDSDPNTITIDATVFGVYALVINQ